MPNSVKVDDLTYKYRINIRGKWLPIRKVRISERDVQVVTPRGVTMYQHGAIVQAISKENRV